MEQAFISKVDSDWGGATILNQSAECWDSCFFSNAIYDIGLINFTAFVSLINKHLHLQSNPQGSDIFFMLKYLYFIDWTFPQQLFWQS